LQNNSYKKLCTKVKRKTNNKITTKMETIQTKESKKGTFTEMVKAAIINDKDLKLKLEKHFKKDRYTIHNYLKNDRQLLVESIYAIHIIATHLQISPLDVLTDKQIIKSLTEIEEPAFID